jgi:F0F1-type ATP synthase gamma subunit
MNGIVLVTGGTGSFGSAMVAHLLEAGHDEIRVFSRDEVKRVGYIIVSTDRGLCGAFNSSIVTLSRSPTTPAK